MLKLKLFHLIIIIVIILKTQYFDSAPKNRDTSWTLFWNPNNPQTLRWYWSICHNGILMKCSIYLSIVKHLEKIGSVCGRHLIFMNFPPKNWEGYYAYSSRVRGKLSLFIFVRTIPLLRSRQRNLLFINLVIFISLVHDKFCVMLHDR